MRFFFFILLLVCSDSFGMYCNTDDEIKTLGESASSLIDNFSQETVELFKKSIDSENSKILQLKNKNTKEVYQNRVDYCYLLLSAAELLLKVQKSKPHSNKDISTLSALASHGGLLNELITRQALKLGITLEDDPDEFDGF